jgi:alkyl hydroperoxide reductase subunit AhpC
VLTVGDKFPKFSLKAVKAGAEGLGGPDLSFTTITSEDNLNKWKVIFFWPMDFTFVCPTEVVDFNKIAKEFKDRDTILYGISIDSEFAHLGWRVGTPDLRDLSIPLLSDLKRELSTELGILDKTYGVPLRATFIVDPTDTIRWVMINDLYVGRNPREVLRVLDALLTGQLCEASWQKGDKTLVPQTLFDNAIALLDVSIDTISKHTDAYKNRKK